MRWRGSVPQDGGQLRSLDHMAMTPYEGNGFLQVRHRPL
jgi:hypothetical protein